MPALTLYGSETTSSLVATSGAITLVVPVPASLLPVAVSVAVSVCDPAVLNVTKRVATPPEKEIGVAVALPPDNVTAVPEGSVTEIAESVLPSVTVSEKPGTIVFCG